MVVCYVSKKQSKQQSSVNKGGLVQEKRKAHEGTNLHSADSVHVVYVNMRQTSKEANEEMSNFEMRERKQDYRKLYFLYFTLPTNYGKCNKLNKNEIIFILIRILMICTFNAIIFDSACVALASHFHCTYNF